MCVCVYVCVGEGLWGCSLCGIRRFVRRVLQDQRGAEWPPRVPTSGGEGQRLPDTPAVDLQFRQRRVVVGLGLVAQRPRRRGPLLGGGNDPNGGCDTSLAPSGIALHVPYTAKKCSPHFQVYCALSYFQWVVAWHVRVASLFAIGCS